MSSLVTRRHEGTKVGEMKREMLATVERMAEELALVTELDDEAEDAVARLRLHLGWLRGRFEELRRVEARELAAMRRGLLRVGDRSLLEEVGV